MPTLSLCQDLPVDARFERISISGLPASPSKRFHKRVTIAREVWRYTATARSKTAIASARAIFDSCGYSGVFTWTPPTEGTPRAFRFVQGTFRETSSTANAFTFNIDAIYLPGVTP